MTHRPTTRSKNKRQKPDDNADIASDVFRRIHSTGQVTPEDIGQLYMIWKPNCQGCRVNAKDNPNCFCGLIPPSNGSRKSGLWQKTSEVVQMLGPDPSIDLRAPPDSPAGLTNLGATCYANSILQCLYMNKSFREGVFSIEPAILKEQPVLNQLARLFAQLHASKMSFVDSAPFIKSLELDNAVQQDSHEFLTLFFSLLEQCLSCSNVTKARTIVQDLFRGGVSHVTKCSECGNASEASSKVEDFYELELNVKGLKSLQDSLDDYLSVEELEGENQYYCESCAKRVNAARSIKLRSLPSVLHFQLKRCVFLPNTTTKKKITSAFCFPDELNMARRLFAHSESELMYDLSAVLIHKGSAVNSGHYVAHIKDVNTQQWWEFDDEHVSNLGRHPFGESSRSNVKPNQTESVNHSNSEPVNAVKENVVDVDSPQSLDSNGVNHVKTFSSSDAYMLMYTLRSTKINAESIQLESREDKMLDSNGSLPSNLAEEVEHLNALYLQKCEQFKSKKELELNHMAERRQEVRLILSEAPVQSPEESFYWISFEWLRQWADNISPSNIENTAIQCLHGKAPVSKVGHMKRLSAKAWMELFLKYGGGPVLGNDDCCIDCLLETAKTMVHADSYRDRRTLMKELAEAALAGKCLDGKLYFVSKAWLQQWLRRKSTNSPCEADAGPTSSIRCPHGELLPEQASGAKRLLVPESLWIFLFEIANSVRPDDDVGCSPFPSDSMQCSQCSTELTEVACLEDNLREFKTKQRQNHEKLAFGRIIALDTDTKYYLMPSLWLSKWKSYITAFGKNAAGCVAPETLNSVIDLLKCEKHEKLLQRPPDLIWKRGMIIQKPPNADGMAIVTVNDWELFCEVWGGMKENGISAEVELVDGAVGCIEDMPATEENIDSCDEINGDAESRRPTIRTCPEVCEDCIGERESCELVRKLNYQNEDICICLVRGKEPPRSVLEASGSASEPNRRSSKRSRKTSFGNSINLNVSGSTSIYQLKMMIWESFGVVKENQILHKGSRTIDGESATLADLNIFPGDVLWVRDSEIHENRDIADEFSDHKMEVQKAEEGFRGTLLTSNTTQQVITEACSN